MNNENKTDNNSDKAKIPMFVRLWMESQSMADFVSYVGTRYVMSRI